MTDLRELASAATCETSGGLITNLMSHNQRFLDDTALEFDAILLANHIREIVKRPSSEFSEFVRTWEQDEAAHYEGFATLYALSTPNFNLGRQKIDVAMARRLADFNDMAGVKFDEFSICLMFAYDELMNSWAYKGVYAFYDSFNEPMISRWIRQLARDGARHSLMAINVLKQRHHHRFSEASGLLHDIVALDTNRKAYAGTFVLDRGSDMSNAAWNEGRRAADIVQRRLTTTL